MQCNHQYKSEISYEMFHIISTELNINGNICDLLEKYFKILSKYEKHYAKEFDSKYNDYRDIDQKETTESINKKLNMLAIHKELSNLDSDETQMDFDATTLYPSAMWDEKSNYPEIETVFAFKPDMNDAYVEPFKNKLLTTMVMTLLY